MNYKTYLSLAIIAIAVIISVYLWNSNSQSKISIASEKQLYTCGMHPEIISEEPGNCPVCGMKLVPKNKSDSAINGERKILYWRAPMDPNEIYDKPGKSKMGMDLVPVYDDNIEAGSIVQIDGVIQQNMNVKISSVEEKELSGEIFTNGVLTTDERNEYIVTTKVNGWIEKLYVNYTGQKITKGQKLVDIYSPELVSAQQELLTALDYQNSTNLMEDSEISNSGNQLVKNTIQKLLLLDISKSKIDEIIRTKEIEKYLTLYAPTNGTVLLKNVIEGEKIIAGKQLLHIADLSNLWLKADIYESELSKVSIGSSAKINFTYLPEKTYSGIVDFIYPTVDPQTRVVQLRMNIKNINGELKPEMFANVQIKGNSFGIYPVVSESSIIRSGKHNVVILSFGEGKFKPVEVRLGAYSNGFYQILSGLNAGDKIVSSAQFMIDSESSLKAAVNAYAAEVNDVKSKANIGKVESNVNSKVEQEHGESIIREGIINVIEIDKNKDGKVFQDMMDWNVISDKDGKCILCNMNLKEVTIDEAKKNLQEHGYDYK
ncbi:MAG: efflux RND transporter periplasmic adaptor subunit [Ignavibacteriae bacterium]|nr:efflux RND transporter periplasmic adaptor subunit [Ignavibacteriota bacterium]